MIKLKSLLLQENSLKRINDIKLLIPKLVIKAQEKYDEWSQDDDGMDDMLGSGGICQEIADGFSDVFNSNGIDATTVSAEIGEQHVWTIIKLDDGVYEVDIPPSVYETGGGYSWKKRPNVRFDSSDIIINRLSADPNKFDENVGY